jgi:hypothetical protein
MSKKKNDSHRTLWFSFHILAVEWKVLLVDPKMFQEYLSGNEGVCINPLATILIDWNLADTQKGNVFFHELVHAVNFSIGVENAIKMSGPEDPEETLTSMQAPLLYAALLGAKFLKLPALP